ncbi:polysaccharide biosynthesis tyrosine autokinase [Granulicella arctica]|uniref:polysaccharide biosynthesis tyrosine autokinase n=1 Tax=Granulicella arctica TaxID=940613 RepID=UPI0021E0CFC0|nr:polysaccharide biosynthesis tyrosine autokinase [Granulicella arctica]
MQEPLLDLPMAPKEFSVVDLWKVVRRRRTVVLAGICGSILLGAVVSLATPRLYRAEAKLQILKQDAAAGLSDPAQASASAAADALDFNLAVQTQVDVLKSRNMALRIIRELGIDKEADYQLRGGKYFDENRKSLEQSPKHLAYVLSKYDKRLHVDSVSGSRLISVSFLDASPARSAQVVNQLLADFIEYNYQVRLTASSQANSVLANELQSMKAQVDSSQANVAKLQQQSGIYGVDEANNSTNAKLDQLNAQLTAAQANLAVKQSIYKLATTRSPEVLAGMLGAQATGANTTNAPLQLLRQQQADAAANYSELNAHYGSQYPRVLQAGQRLQSIQTSINAEIDRLVGQAAAEYKVAVDTEASATRALQMQKNVAAQMNRDATLYTSAKHEADASRDLYEQLLRRLKEAGVLAGLRSTNLSVLDPAILPDKPSQPIVLLYLLIAALIGLVVGVIGAFLIDAIDETIRDPQKIEDLLGYPVLALIPPVEKSLSHAAVQSLQRSSHGSIWQYQVTAKAPRSAVAEAFRVLRTAVLSTLRKDKDTVMAISSTSESEGKSFITFNLAAALAQSGRTVLVIDADLRKRTLTHALALENRDGLDEAVGEQNWQKYITTYEEVPGLFVLPAGHQIHFPSDVLGSPAMKELVDHLRSAFDFILIDTPSILDVTDTVSLSQSVDGIVLVAKCGKTPQHSLARTLSVLQRANARVLGVVMNNMDFRSADFYYYWGKQSSGYAPTSAQIFSPAARIVSSRTTIALLALSTLFGTAFGQGVSAHPISVSSQNDAPFSQPGSMANIAPQKTIIGTGDLLSIGVYDAPELTQEVRVNSEGSIHLTLLGDITAVGLQPDKLAHSIEADLKDRNFIRDPHVSVSVKEFTTQGVTVEGEVKKPGLYPVFSSRSLVDVIALADGVTSTADTHITIRRQGGSKIDRVTLSQDNGREVADNDVRVFPGDTVIVPRTGLTYVLGDVQRPGGYMMRDNGSMTILQAISEAQGTTRNASLKHVMLLRKEDGVTHTIPIELKAIQRGQQPDQALLAGDILFVPTSGLKSFANSTAGIAASVSGAALYAVAR